MTAAHCFQCANWFVAAGNTVTFAQSATFSSGLAAGPALHPDAPGCNLPGAFDVAVITLSNPVPSNIAQPVPMLLHDNPFNPINDSSLVQPCLISGYGGTVIFSSSQGADGNRRAGNLVPSWYRDTCGDVCEGLCNDDFFWRTDLNSSHAVSASGDSGGGMFCTLNGVQTVLGVDSGWEQFDSFCNTEENAIWASLTSPVREWLIDQLDLPDVTPLIEVHQDAIVFHAPFPTLAWL